MLNAVYLRDGTEEIVNEQSASQTGEVNGSPTERMTDYRIIGVKRDGWDDL